MKKSLTVIAIILGLISLTGCSTGPGQPQIHKIQTQQKEVSLKLNFPKNDPVTKKAFNISKIDKINLKQQIINYMYKKSNYRKYSTFTIKDENLINSPLLKISLGKATIRKGLQINDENHIFIFKYMNSKNNFTTFTKFKIPYKFYAKKIIINYPNKYTYIPATDWKGTQIKPLDNPQNLKKDVFRILNNLKNVKLYISKRYILQGEINTNYPANSIYANFKRLMGQYRGNYYWENSTEKISPIEKENTFNLKIKNKIYPLNIKVYPYRNGSKVIYKAYISYKVYSDGTSTLTKKDIENAKKEIKRVVND
ncbi:hypothetical protein [Caminibacter mediatlanticus]|uniref:Lipoprotein n=1 Tax=Caminibacter mediatlanticus TB-2 TaxID=391592 RepID=A0AAI9AHQ5_9BACT|nr:hypothetical protein [Caminibacter mediatlanticus]EDM23815.1 hypothetical protein CMTB2_01069 [Caminibacter mediatlanticus TB-2]